MYRDYIQLRHDLFPYIYSAALNGHLTGMPILRSMPLVYPDDRNVDDMVFQYMFGDNLLIGVFSDSIYLPKGDWIDFWTGEQLRGEGKEIRHAIPDNRAGLACESRCDAADAEAGAVYRRTSARYADPEGVPVGQQFLYAL